MELNPHNKQEYPPMHTAEHLLNGTISCLIGCPRAFSTHIERKKSKLDFRIDRNLTASEIEQIENTVNQAIASAVEVSERFVTRTEATQQFDLSRLPEQASELLRIVEVGEWDSCPCIGAHVKNTAEIPPITIISTDWAEGVLRVRFKFRQVEA